METNANRQGSNPNIGLGLIIAISVLAIAILGSRILPMRTKPKIVMISPTNQPFSPTKTDSPVTEIIPDFLTNTPEPMIGCVSNKGTLNVRSGPGIDQEIISGLASGTCITILEFDSTNTWAKINNGWVSMKYIEMQDSASNIAAIAPTIITITPIRIIPTLTSEPTAFLSPTTKPTRYSSPTPEPTKALLLCSQAKVGQVTTCMIERGYCSYKPSVKGSPTFCNDRQYPMHTFTFLAWGEDLSAYNGSCMIVSGLVKLYDGKPQIVGSGSSIRSCN